MVSKFKAFIKAFSAWLDRKFPDRVEVTPAEWATLKSRLDKVEEILKTMPKIEAEINKFNIQLGFSGLTDKMVAPFSHR